MTQHTSSENEAWYRRWFNEDYMRLYAYRHEQEARQQVEFLVRALKLKGDERILDLGCGAGRHAILLAMHGHSVVGVDLSSYSITEAKKKQALAPYLKLEFMEKDMRDLEDLGTFDVVISMFTSFGFFPTDEENEEVLKQVRKCLRVGGQLFMDYLHPHHVKAHLVPAEDLQIGEELVQIERKIEGDRVIKMIRFPTRSYEERVKLYPRKKMEEMFLKSGLRPLDVWNDYNGNPWKKEGERQLFRCEAF